MMSPFTLRLIKVISRSFFFFLDISGMLLGTFLIVIGALLMSGRPLSFFLAFVLFMCGLFSFLIHASHYFHVKILAWLAGSEYFYYPPKVTEEEEAIRDEIVRSLKI
jgi:hypothetical protein